MLLVAHGHQRSNSNNFKNQPKKFTQKSSHIDIFQFSNNSLDLICLILLRVVF